MCGLKKGYPELEEERRRVIVNTLLVEGVNAGFTKT